MHRRRSSTAELVTNGTFVRDAILPLDPSQAGQMPLWQERVRLDEGFFAEHGIDPGLPSAVVFCIGRLPFLRCFTVRL
jgi:hypothetical protein